MSELHDHPTTSEWLRDICKRAQESVERSQRELEQYALEQAEEQERILELTQRPWKGITLEPDGSGCRVVY
ncbi:hypothetical protein [Nocardia sp. NPDC051570]|uniref:hypothetical protein n=1 Tax=Nocardia sp. NPDC051570 TaxID=3364324 RepID=UPI0037B23675